MGTSDKSDRILKKLATTLANCSKEAATYAACVEAALPNVQRGCCSEPFGALKKCFWTQLNQFGKSAGVKKAECASFLGGVDAQWRTEVLEKHLRNRV